MFGKGGNGQDIVSMTDREKQRRLAPLRQVEAYWRGLCDGTAVPLRSQIDPRGMESALESAFLMERIAPSMAKIRVAGTHLNDLMGMQIAGMPLSSLIAPDDRERFGTGVAALFADPAVVRMELRAEGGFGKPDLEASLILLPLRSDFGDLTRGLGALVSHGRIGRTPRRFRIERLDIVPALDGQPAETDGILERRPVHVPELPKTGDRTLGLGNKEQPKLVKDSSPKAATPSDRPVRETPKGNFLRLVVNND